MIELARLGLGDYRESEPGDEFRDSLEAAKQTLDPVASASVNTHTRRIVYLKSVSRVVPPESVFSSASFHELPGLTFLTSLASRHLPANFVFPSTTTYAIQENLYHESIHQELFGIIRLHGLLASPGPLPRVRIPWRNADWDLEKVLHAGAVYARVYRMRALHGRPVAERESARAARDVLLSPLVENLPRFSRACAELVESLREGA